MLAFFTSKIGVYLIAAFFIILFIASIVLEIRYLENRVENLATANAQLAVANQSLAKSMEALQKQQLQITQEFTNAHNTDLQAYKAIQSTVTQITTKSAQIARIRAKKPALLINLINKNLECERVHFLDNGKCVNGKWQVAT